ncbi:MAG: nucleoside deaminase [Planctomycetota bacterium]|nr:nucleoside deaminase [Planctomycetota bacterium]
MKQGKKGLNEKHRRFMRMAIAEARAALDAGDVPVGAVVVKDGMVVSKGHNQRELLKDPTAHAEMIAITAAAEGFRDWRLNGCELYVTLEPCPMCASAIQQARIARVIFGAYDPVMGACESVLKITSDKRLGGTVETVAPVMEAECAELLAEFFSSLRNKRE